MNHLLRFAQRNSLIQEEGTFSVDAIHTGMFSFRELQKDVGLPALLFLDGFYGIIKEV